MSDKGAALQRAGVARRESFRARRNYHEALVVAERAGATAAELAEALDTRELYVSNAIRLHRAGECGCFAPPPSKR